MPDGIAVDAQGGLWVALWDGGRVIRLDATGHVTAQVSVPALRVTSVAFGDEDLRTLYLTTARTGLNEATLKAYPGSGRVHFFHTDVPGLSVAGAALFSLPDSSPASPHGCPRRAT
ncbi:SMP-30/gluconolactonase/LRE family protein [Fodinicola feengrottensis]|nr:SMP-30/gluconolactonase/LRE family protein [Fodinicola feengrottensis]